MQIIVVLLILIIVILASMAGFFYVRFTKIDKTINVFLEKGQIQDLREVFFAQGQKIENLEVKLKEAFEKVKNLENFSKVSLQKIGVVRFNPFSDIGGNQSFAIAMLDQENTGFVISSLFIKEGNRVYAKQVTQGKSDHVLSSEEEVAITKAIKNG